MIEVFDVATPATYVRYTNNWKGSGIGWQNPEDFQPKKEIKGLGNSYMCGQWAGNGGLPMVLTSGRNVAQIICKRGQIENICDHVGIRTVSSRD